MLKIEFEGYVPKGYLDSGWGKMTIYCENDDLFDHEIKSLIKHHCILCCDVEKARLNDYKKVEPKDLDWFESCYKKDKTVEYNGKTFIR